MKTRILPLTIALVLLGVLVGGLVMVPRSVQVEAADTPLTVITVNDAGIAAATNWTGRVWADGYDRATNADIFWTIDQPATPNTTTLKLQVSPDNTIWADYVTLATANVADVSGAYTTTSILGKYFRITATAGNTETFTPTLKVVLR